MTRNETQMAKIHSISPELYEALVDGASRKLLAKGLSNPTGEQISKEAVKWLAAVMPRVIKERAG